MTNTTQTKSEELLALAAKYDAAAISCTCGALAMEYRSLANAKRGQAWYWARRGQ